MKEALKLSKPNAKTVHMLDWLREHMGLDLKKSEFASLSILSGVSCPGADKCKAWVKEEEETRVLYQAKHAEFRCFAASDEATYKETFAQRKHNRGLIKKAMRSVPRLTDLLLQSIPQKIKLFRFHIGGDVFSFNYLLAIIAVAVARPETRFYMYTKSLHFLMKVDQSLIPGNLRIVMSEGGRYDDLIPELKGRGFSSARVVFSQDEADKLGLEVDHRDNLAAYGDRDFALMIHGPQRKGSPASKAVSALRVLGDSGYSKKRARV